MYGVRHASIKYTESKREREVDIESKRVRQRKRDVKRLKECATERDWRKIILDKEAVL